MGEDLEKLKSRPGNLRDLYPIRASIHLQLQYFPGKLDDTGFTARR
jgi:hypothetical protein